MAFQRNKNKISQNSSINIFGEMLSQAANATTNINQDMINASVLLGISSQKLSKMMLSPDNIQKNFITLIYNLSNTLKDYPNNELPEQLSQYINQLTEEINNNQLNEDTLPAYFDLLYSNVQVINTLNNYNNEDANENENDNENNNNNDNEEYYQYDNQYNNHNQVNLISINAENIKNDVCVICFLNLDQEKVVETKCKHQYHNNCIKHWLQVKHSCPLCNNML